MDDQLIGFLFMIIVFGMGSVILVPFIVQHHKTRADWVLAGIASILLFPALVYVSGTLFALHIDIPLILSMSLLVGVVGLFYGFKRHR